MIINIDIFYIVRWIFMNLFVCFIFAKIINYTISKNKILLILFFNILFSFLFHIIEINSSTILGHIFVILSFGSLMCKITKAKIGYSLLVAFISWSINSLLYYLAVTLAFFPHKLLLGLENDFINLSIIFFIHLILMYFFSKIKKFKNGFAFLQNTERNHYIDISVLNISIIALFIYFVFTIVDDSMTVYLFSAFAVISIILLITIFKTFSLYYKHKLVEQTMEDYKKQIKEKDEEIVKLSAENFNFLKINHEFYHKQRALEHKVEKFLSNINNIETNHEFSLISDISVVTEDYSSQIFNVVGPAPLSKTEIKEIDDMFSYMNSECYKKGISFQLVLNGNIHYIVNNLIPKDKLVTLIADHLKDAIIAIEAGNNGNKAILAVLGKHEDFYEFCIHDSGIPFEINTLIYLGLNPITTHATTGGSGIGFVTTFETLRESKSSLIIKENPLDNIYSKEIVICFDNKHDYKIRSYRANEIREKSFSERIIIEDL